MTRRKIPWDTWGPKRFPSAQCQAFLECENIPGPSGYCAAHPPRRKQVRMTPAELREWWESCAPGELERILTELGVGSIDELVCVRLSISTGGAVVRQRDLKDANEAFSDTLPGRDD